MDTFIAEGLWDEARVITNTTLFAKGVAAPQLPAAQHTGSETVLTDRVDYFYNAHNS
jgi:diaminohydroxyphosphoribosylaminopyrimidine deaminase/5-amino-6-(5-phosphoribosylamino)uracil reductase